MLPPSTNNDFRGHPLAAWALALFAILAIVPGGIHAFTPDGGLVTIAHLDISANPHQFIGMSNWIGAIQIPWGILLLAVSLRYRSLVPLCLFLVFMQAFINASNQWVFRPPAAGAHHPPEMYGTLVAIPLALIFLWLSLPPSKD